MRILNNWKLLTGACLTLGLAPFFPEPHIWGKVKWISGGAVGMQLIDWIDTVFHGLPWVLLIGQLLLLGYRKLATNVGKDR